MKTKELLPKKDKDLLKEIQDLTEKLVRVRMDIHLKKKKDFREISRTKKDIARIKTVLSERKIMAKENTKVMQPKEAEKPVETPAGSEQ